MIVVPEPRSSYTFSAKYRLKRREDFKRTFAKRCSCANDSLIIYICANGLDVARLGLSVGRKVGKATVRNRCKRLIREAFRLEQIGMKFAGFDLICIPRTTQTPNLNDYRQALQRLVPKAIKKLSARSGTSAT